MDIKVVKQYLNANKKLTLLRGKIASEEKWNNILISEQDIFNHQGNLGWVLESCDLCVDVDPRNGGNKSLKELCKDLKINITATVMTPSGGFHSYFKVPPQYQNLKIKKNIKKYPGIDFLSKGHYCVITSSVTENGIYKWVDEELGCFEQSTPPIALMELISYVKKDNSEEDFNDYSSHWSANKVKKMLDKLDPSMMNDEWVKVGMALHDWDPLCGFDLWEEWSKDGDNYDEGETEKRWSSFNKGDGVTLGTIYYMVKEVLFDENIERVNGYIEKIKHSDEKNLEFVIGPQLKKENFTRTSKEKLAKSIQDRFKEISGVKMPIASIRAMINPYNITGELVNKEEIPEWCNEWVYVDSHASFINKNNLSIIKTESFNLKCGGYVPLSIGGSKCSASKYVADNSYMESVDSLAYLPTVNDLISTIDGSKVLNIFNPNTVPFAATYYSEEGLAAIEKIKKHIKFIFGTDENSEIFIQWLAHQVQFPGKKILWAPVIQSIQGIGKSFFGTLLRFVCGNANIGTVSPTQITSNFNGWATGVHVNILEEVRIKGHNRYDAVNALKPLITDPFIQINEKGVKPYNTYNTVNYLCFTNHKDAIPMDGDDRRWWVIFVQIQNISELYKYVGENADTYFPSLFEALRQHYGEIRKWLLEYNISEKFLNTKQAPMTDYKEAMIATEETGFEGLQELKEMIQKGGKYYNENCISSSDLFGEFMIEHAEFNIQDRQKHQLLKKMGYMTYNNPIKIDKKARRIWSKKPMTSDEIRKCFSLFDEEL